VYVVSGAGSTYLPAPQTTYTQIQDDTKKKRKLLKCVMEEDAIYRT
jgi:hypothetical protein